MVYTKKLLLNFTYRNFQITTKNINRNAEQGRGKIERKSNEIPNIRLETIAKIKEIF